MTNYQAPHLYINEHLVLAGTMSILAAGAVYIAFLTDDKVPNAVVASITALAMLSMCLGWAFYAGRIIRDKFAVMEARIDEIQTDRVIERAMAAGYLKEES